VWNASSSFQSAAASDPDDLLDLVDRMQRTRFDDQRCQIGSTDQKMRLHHRRHCSILLSSIFDLVSFVGASTQLDDILNTVDRLQQYRLDDQRTALPRTPQPPVARRSTRLSPLNEQFFDEIAKSQVDHRSTFRNRHSALFRIRV
jgi:hypothetical protein